MQMLGAEQEEDTSVLVTTSNKINLTAYKADIDAVAAYTKRETANKVGDSYKRRREAGEGGRQGH